MVSMHVRAYTLHLCDHISSLHLRTLNIIDICDDNYMYVLITVP